MPAPTVSPPIAPSCESAVSRCGAHVDTLRRSGCSTAVVGGVDDGFGVFSGRES